MAGYGLILWDLIDVPIRSLVILARLEQQGTGDLQVLLETPGGWGGQQSVPILLRLEHNIVNGIIWLQKVQKYFK